ncbi:hypothetical protein ACIPW9_07915 [Streptomyces sp. NPDC090052]|uniref:hypothetical protein n=1 Tax=Streptomyces sp. NPDC090052 TaxID=3365931 RepID=UPI003824EDF7
MKTHIVAVHPPRLRRGTVACVHLDRGAVGLRGTLHVQALALRRVDLDHPRGVADPSGTARRPVVLPAGEMVSDPGLAQQLAQRLGPGGEGLRGRGVRVQDLFALHLLGGDLLLPLRGSSGRYAPEHLVRIDRVTPRTAGEPGLQILDGDPVLRASRLRSRVGEAAGRKEDASVVRARAPGRRSLQPFESIVFGNRTVPVVFRQAGGVGVLAVERSADGVHCLQRLRISLGVESW